MKIRIREGNDFDVVWAITRAGQPEDLSTATNMKLTLVVYGATIEHNLFTVTDNVLSINIPKEVATIKGDYRLVFEYTLPDAGQPDGDLKCKTDVVPFRIVPFTADADDVYTVNTSSDVLLGFKGDKGDDGDDAYQIWLDLGNVGTYEDFITYLRQPAVDAGESISELEGVIGGREAARVIAENNRIDAEELRVQAEGERITSEITRVSNEDSRIDAEALRITAEGIRGDNENSRIAAESDRNDAEELRSTAELLRDAAETERDTSEGIRVSAETARNTAEGLRSSAETLRGTNEATRQTQESARQTNTATAISNANMAASAANTAAGLADDARLAIQDDLALKADQTELDQLAGNVSLKADHGYTESPKTLKRVDDEKLDKTSVKQTSGTSTTDVMSQDSVTRGLAQAEVNLRKYNIEAEAIQMMGLAGSGKTQTISLEDNKIVFNHNPMFMSPSGKWFKIFPMEATIFEISLSANYVYYVNREDVDNIAVNTFLTPAYIDMSSYYHLGIPGNIMKNTLPILVTGNSSEVFNSFAIGRFYFNYQYKNKPIDKSIWIGSDSFFTDETPSVLQTIQKDTTNLTVSFNKNPRIMNMKGGAAYLFPSDSSSYVLPTLTAYTVLYVENSALGSNTWNETKYLSVSDIKTSVYVSAQNWENRTIIAINQTGNLVNIGAVGHKYFNDLTKTIPAINQEIVTTNLRVDGIEDYIPMGVERAFPQKPSYYNLLKEKCPNFHKAMMMKNKDVTVCVTGTSLSQGNSYTTVRSDATTRAPLMHGYDLASLIFDKMINLWSGQQYRRHDHADLTYSASTWQTTDDLVIDDVHIWDDNGGIKRGMTKTTVSQNASVSVVVPADAWQFNFIYRTDSTGGACSVAIAEGVGKMEVYNGTAWVEANGYTFTMLEPAATATKGNTIFQKRLKMRCKNKETGGINSIGEAKNLTISKGADSARFNVVGFEWSQREFMFTMINGSRGAHNWGLTVQNLETYQDGDIWEFSPDLILCEVTAINWGTSSDLIGLPKDPLYFVNIAKRAYFNEFDDWPNSIYEKSNHWTRCEVIFYGGTLSASTAFADAWDENHQPKFGLVTSAATNGVSPPPTDNVGRKKTIFENHDAIDDYMLGQNYIYIPVTRAFKAVADTYYGTYWAGFQASGYDGDTFSSDGTHLNNNGAKMWAWLISPLFEW